MEWFETYNDGVLLQKYPVIISTLYYKGKKLLLLIANPKLYVHVNFRFDYLPAT